MKRMPEFPGLHTEISQGKLETDCPSPASGVPTKGYTIVY